MLDEVKEIVKKVKETDRYLVSCFLLENKWKVDFYSPGEHIIYTYTENNGKLEVQKDEIFQKEKHDLEKLDLEQVKIHYKEALEKITKSGDRFIIILQSINKKAVWNITLLTHEFKVYNLKVDASNGETLEETEESILNFKKDILEGNKKD
ncbi:hypothetical protein J4477_03995 [Candidatus Pacearchaeota archaeon]|nr:hypothetical protein [Candidatus Pacearchaeota archaeon]